MYALNCLSLTNSCLRLLSATYCLRLLAYKADPIRGQVNRFGQPASIHLGNGFDVRAGFCPTIHYLAGRTNFTHCALTSKLSTFQPALDHERVFR